MTWRPGGLHGFPGVRGTSVTRDAGSKRKDARRALPFGMMVRCAFYADLHIHSKFSRACSRTATWSTSPGGRGARASASSELVTSRTRCGGRSLGEKLVPDAPGLFRLRPDLERAVHDTLPLACRAPSAVHAVVGDLDYLQAGRTHPEGAPPASTRLRSRPSTRSPGRSPAWGPRLGRQADPRARLAEPP